MAFLARPIVFGVLVLAFGIPACLRGFKRGLTGIIAAVSAMSFWLLVGLLF